MHTPPLALLFSLRRTMILAALTVITTIAALLCAPAESRGEFLEPAWRGDSDATWYQWANPYGPETLISPDPELYSYAPGSSLVPTPAPSGTASLVTPLVPIGTGNFYNGVFFGPGPFVPDTFMLSVPSLLQSGSAGTIWLQVRGSLGEFNSFISTPRLAVGAGTVSASLLRQVTTGTAGGGGFGSTVVETLYGWESVVTDGGLLQIAFENANHVSLMAFSVDTSATVAPVPEPTTAAMAAAAALAAAGLAGRRRVRRRPAAQRAPAAGAEMLEDSPSSNCSSSSRSSRCSSGSSCPPCNQPARAPDAASA
jgi:hypothetical protein